MTGARADRRYACLELLEPVRGRLAREVGRGPRDLHERELERQARVAALAHVLHGHGQQVDEPEHGRRRQLVRLLAQSVTGLLGHRQRLGHLAEMLDEHEVTQVLEQVGDEPSEVLAVLGELLEVCERPRRVAVDDEVADPEQRLLLDCAEHLEHVLDGDLRAGRRRELVENRLGVAVGAARAAGDQRQGGVGRVDPVRVGDAPELRHELGQPRPLEHEGLTARAHRRQHLAQVGGAEDEDEVGRRLLDQLQERVPGGVRELVRLVEDVDLVAPLGRLEDDALADLADVVDPALRGGVHLDDVERGAVGDRDAGVADLVRRRRRPLRAVERLREDPRHRGLAGAARAGEEVRLPHLVGRERVAQCPHDPLLADHLVEVLGPVLPVEGGHAPSKAECPAAHPSSKRVPGRNARRLLGPGRTAAPERESLALLPPGSDAVRMLPVRGTWPSTPRARAQAPQTPSLGRPSALLERISGTGNRYLPA